ncbi:MAG: hypothetical protein ACM3PY_09430 [Omnitrophica WOR_2 bacterium]
MESIALSSLPPHAFVDMGGYTCIRADTWSDYLDSTIREYFPWYYQDHNHRNRMDSVQKDNDCVLESFKQYLFHEHSLVVPEDNLFHLFNRDGKGLLPEQMLAAISCVIEPLGYELDQVLAADEELRNGLGYPEKMKGLSASSNFDGKPGVCMINIKNGYNHAFFWKQMNPAAFLDEKFRMAVLIKARTCQPAPAPSIIESLSSTGKNPRLNFAQS